MGAMLRAQRWSDEQQCDFLLSALEGEPRREILILEQTEWDTPDKIFKQLKELYGDKMSVGALRAMFYDCRQRQEESMRAYILRLRELGQRLLSKEPRDRRHSDLHLRDQFVLGIREVEIQRNLRRLLRQDDGLSFEQVRTEALHLEGDGVDMWSREPTCAAVRGDQINHGKSAWQDQFKAEVFTELKEQIAELKRTFREELRVGLKEATGRSESNQSAPRTYSNDERAYNPGPNQQVRRPVAPRPASEPRHGTPSAGYQSPPGYQWDSQGQPICCKCGTSGHLARECREGAPRSALNE